MKKTDEVTFTVNGVEYSFSVGNHFGQVSANETLLDTLRERLALTGAKATCRQGACGCCTVIMDGEAVPSCEILTVDCEGVNVTTIEGLMTPEGELDPVQKAFLEYHAFQCGFCTPGIIMTTRALLDKNPNPTHEEVEEALAGNYCRCISQYHVFDAIDSVIEEGA